MLWENKNETIKVGIFTSCKWTHVGLLWKAVGEAQPWGRPLEKSVYC